MNSINKTTLTKIKTDNIYSGFLGFITTIGLNLSVALKTKTYCENYYDNFTVNILFETLAVLHDSNIEHMTIQVKYAHSEIIKIKFRGISYSCSRNWAVKHQNRITYTIFQFRACGILY